MRRTKILALMFFAALAGSAGAQTATNAAGAATLSPRPAATPVDERPQNPAAAGLVGFTRNFMQVQTQYSANVISETFAAALQRSRDAVRVNSRPIPDEVKREMIPFYSEAALKDVRYVIGDTSETGLAGFAIRNGNAAAVTLVDTVVFKDEKYVSSLALWAHELHHVEQYQSWGLSGFAARYAFGWKDVEAEASKRASAYIAWYREKHAGH